MPKEGSSRSPAAQRTEASTSGTRRQPPGSGRMWRVRRSSDSPRSSARCRGLRARAPRRRGLRSSASSTTRSGGTPASSSAIATEAGSWPVRRRPTARAAAAPRPARRACRCSTRAGNERRVAEEGGLVHEQVGEQLGTRTRRRAPPRRRRPRGPTSASPGRRARTALARRRAPRAAASRPVRLAQDLGQRVEAHDAPRLATREAEHSAGTRSARTSWRSAARRRARAAEHRARAWTRAGLEQPDASGSTVLGAHALGQEPTAPACEPQAPTLCSDGLGVAHHDARAQARGRGRARRQACRGPRRARGGRGSAAGPRRPGTRAGHGAQRAPRARPRRRRRLACRSARRRDLEGEDGHGHAASVLQLEAGRAPA